MKLNQIADNPGAKRPRKRVGRGIGSGLGKTAGRGGKGQTARKGGAKAGFEGGQMPIYRRLPKRGFNKPNQVEYNEVNLDQLERFEAGSEITPQVLAKNNMLHKPKNPVVLMGRGEISVPLTVRVQRVTKSARQKIEAAGGSIEIIAS
jgi:large subunit ribosomal protein L15